MVRARARGGLHFFWFHLTVGLLLSLFLFAYMSLAPDAEDLQTHARICFAYGMLFGLISWVVRVVSGSRKQGHRN